MLAMSDRYGRVWASIPGLAKEAAVSVDACREAVHKFLSPDPDSRTKVAEGRRIEPIDGGWKLINHAKYRSIRDEEERRAYKTEKQREYRSVDKSVDNVDKSGQVLNGVDPRAHNAEAEAEADTKKEQKPSPKASPSSFLIPAWIDKDAWVGFEEMRRKIRAPLTDRGRRGIVKELEKLCSPGDNAAAILDQSTQNSYRGVFPLKEKSNGQSANGGVRRLTKFEQMRLDGEELDREWAEEDQRRADSNGHDAGRGDGSGSLAPLLHAIGKGTA